MGQSHDSLALDDKGRTVDNPMAETWRLAAGVNFRLGENLDRHPAYTLAWLGNMDDAQTRARAGETLSGTYKNALLHVVGSGATWRFRRRPGLTQG